MYSVSDETRKPIFEGVQGENEAREIQFDISSWIEELGEGVCTATAKRPTDTIPYPVTVTRSGNVVTWKPNSTDTSIEGIGAFQLAFSINNVVAKTRIWNTKIAPSLDPAGDPPDPYDNWLAEMREIEASAIQAAQDADGSADDAAASAASIAGDHDELINIRIGADGTTYANAGDAVRGQITNVKDDLTTLENGFELFTPIYEDGDINSQGAEITSNNWVRSLFIPVGQLINAKINIDFAHSWVYANFVLYDSAKEFISYTHKTESFVFDLYASNVYYVRIVLPKGEYTKEYFSIYAIANWVNSNISYNDTITLKLGNELITQNGHYDSGNWTGDNTNGYTHPTGKSGILSFWGIGVEQNSEYLLEFDTDYDSDEFLTVGIGSQYKVLVYNGDSHIIVPLKSDTGTTLYFQPNTNVAFTISNLSLKKIDANGSTERTIDVYRSISPNHNLNKGFWNILIGEHNMENSIGSTRCLALGYGSMKALQGGHRNIGVGTFTMSQMTGGESNIAMGADAMLALVEGNENIAIGKGAMYLGRKVNNNVAVGAYALTGKNGSYGSNNVSLGKNSGYKCAQSDNVFVGYQAGYNVESGSANTILGSNAYGQATGDYNIAIGRNATYANGVSNSIAIGKNVSANANNQVVIGNADTETIILGNKKLVFNNDGTVTWESLS